MIDILAPYVPEKALMPCFELIQTHGVHLKIVNQRKTRHGDYRLLPSGGHQITVNATENKYRFLITLIHEIAHLVAFTEYGRRIKPHGIEWKSVFKHFMLSFLNPEIFPSELLPVLARHFKNPKASSSSDALLDRALAQYDCTDDALLFVADLAEGNHFYFGNSRIFERGSIKRKRIECVEVKTGKCYLFQPNARVLATEKNE
ncbi:MAG: SprT-like domain-containing protein [Flavobacteriaceae bacterium]